jgi:hypothetical protein
MSLLNKIPVKNLYAGTRDHSPCDNPADEQRHETTSCFIVVPFQFDNL